MIWRAERPGVHRPRMNVEMAPVVGRRPGALPDSSEVLCRLDVARIMNGPSPVRGSRISPTGRSSRSRWGRLRDRAGPARRRPHRPRARRRRARAGAHRLRERFRRVRHRCLAPALGHGQRLPARRLRDRKRGSIRAVGRSPRSRPRCAVSTRRSPRSSAGSRPARPRAIRVLVGVNRCDTVDFPKDGDGCRWDSTPHDRVADEPVKRPEQIDGRDASDEFHPGG